MERLFGLLLSLHSNYGPILSGFSLTYRVGQKTVLFLRSHNFASTDDRKACNTSKVSEFCLEWSA